MFWFLSLTLDEWLFAIGGLIFCLLGNTLVKALAPKQSGALGFITTIVTAVPATLLRLTQKIVSTFAPVTYGPQRRVATGLHDAARLTDDTALVLEAQGALIAALAQALAGTASAADINAATAGLTKRVGNAEKQAAGIGADVLPRIAAVEKGIGADVLPKIAALDRELGRIEGKAIPRVNQRISTADTRIGHLWDWVRAHTVDVAAVTFAGAVAVALGRLGGGWIRCRNWNRLGKSVCGLPFGLLEDLLAAGITAFAVTDLCEFAAVAMGTAELIQPALMALVDVEDALVGCHGASGAPLLEPTRLRLPPNSRNLPLAA